MYGDGELSESSKSSYLKKATRLQEAYAYHLASASGKMISEVNIVPVGLVRWILKRRENQEISAATMRQYRSALKYFYSLFEDRSAQEAIRYLDDNKYIKFGAPKKLKTSALKSKGVSVEKHTALLKAIGESNSKVARTAQSWLHYTYIFGLRPTEWKQVKVIKHDDEDSPEFFLEVINAKSTNGRSHGKTRTFNITKLGIEEIEKLRDFVMYLKAHNNNNSFDALLSTIRSLIAYTCKKIFPAKAKLISLYSYRHQFSANAKKQYGTEYVAAMMGHAVTATCLDNYARKNKAEAPIVVFPILTDVKRVIINHKTIDTKNSLFAKAVESKKKFKI